MPKLLYRWVVLFLVPCLVWETAIPAAAATFGEHEAVEVYAYSHRVDQEALAAPLYSQWRTRPGGGIRARISGLLALPLLLAAHTALRAQDRSLFAASRETVSVDELGNPNEVEKAKIHEAFEKAAAKFSLLHLRSTTDKPVVLTEFGIPNSSALDHETLRYMVADAQNELTPILEMILQTEGYDALATLAKSSQLNLSQFGIQNPNKEKNRKGRRKPKGTLTQPGTRQKIDEWAGAPKGTFRHWLGHLPNIAIFIIEDIGWKTEGRSVAQAILQGSLPAVLMSAVLLAFTLRGISPQLTLAVGVFMAYRILRFQKPFVRGHGQDQTFLQEDIRLAGVSILNILAVLAGYFGVRSLPVPSMHPTNVGPWLALIALNIAFGLAARGLGHALWNASFHWLKGKGYVKDDYTLEQSDERQQPADASVTGQWPDLSANPEFALSRVLYRTFFDLIYISELGNPYRQAADDLIRTFRRYHIDSGPDNPQSEVDIRQSSILKLGTLMVNYFSELMGDLHGDAERREIQQLRWPHLHAAIEQVRTEYPVLDTALQICLAGGMPNVGIHFSRAMMSFLQINLLTLAAYIHLMGGELQIYKDLTTYLTTKYSAALRSDGDLLGFLIQSPALWTGWHLLGNAFKKDPKENDRLWLAYVDKVIELDMEEAVLVLAAMIPMHVRQQADSADLKAIAKLQSYLARKLAQCKAGMETVPKPEGPAYTRLEQRARRFTLLSAGLFFYARSDTEVFRAGDRDEIPSPLSHVIDELREAQGAAETSPETYPGPILPILQWAYGRYGKDVLRQGEKLPRIFSYADNRPLAEIDQTGQEVLFHFAEFYEFTYHPAHPQEPPPTFWDFVEGRHPAVVQFMELRHDHAKVNEYFLDYLNRIRDVLLDLGHIPPEAVPARQISSAIDADPSIGNSTNQEKHSVAGTLESAAHRAGLLGPRRPSERHHYPRPTRSELDEIEIFRKARRAMEDSIFVTIMSQRPEDRQEFDNKFRQETNRETYVSVMVHMLEDPSYFAGRKIEGAWEARQAPFAKQVVSAAVRAVVEAPWSSGSAQTVTPQLERCLKYLLMQPYPDPDDVSPSSLEWLAQLSRLVRPESRAHPFISRSFRSRIRDKIITTLGIWLSSGLASKQFPQAFPELISSLHYLPVTKAERALLKTLAREDSPTGRKARQLLGKPTPLGDAGSNPGEDPDKPEPMPSGEASSIGNPEALNPSAQANGISVAKTDRIHMVVGLLRQAGYQSITHYQIAVLLDLTPATVLKKSDWLAEFDIQKSSKDRELSEVDKNEFETGCRLIDAAGQTPNWMTLLRFLGIRATPEAIQAARTAIEKHMKIPLPLAAKTQPEPDFKEAFKAGRPTAVREARLIPPNLRGTSIRYSPDEPASIIDPTVLIQRMERNIVRIEACMARLQPQFAPVLCHALVEAVRSAILFDGFPLLTFNLARIDATSQDLLSRMPDDWPAVLLSLFVNALREVMNDSAPQLGIAMGQEGNRSYIRISALGSGVPVENPPMPTSESVIRGTGYDLNDTRAIVNKRGGGLEIQGNSIMIWFSSVPAAPQGSSFDFQPEADQGSRHPSQNLTARAA